MRKGICAFFALLILLSIGVPTALAARANCPRKTLCEAPGICLEDCRYTDSDENGICDNCEKLRTDCTQESCEDAPCVPETQCVQQQECQRAPAKNHGHGHNGGHRGGHH